MASCSHAQLDQAELTDEMAVEVNERVSTSARQAIRHANVSRKHRQTKRQPLRDAAECSRAELDQTELSEEMAVEFDRRADLEAVSPSAGQVINRARVSRNYHMHYRKTASQR